MSLTHTIEYGLNPHNAPIILAICEIRYLNIENFEHLKLKDLLIKFKNYPEYQERVIGQLMLRDILGEKQATFQNQKIDSYLFISSDKKTDFSLNIDKFDFSLHFNYTGWPDFIKEIKRIWDILIEKIGKVVVTGISIRYVNKIEVTGPMNDPSEYFNTSIQVTENIKIPFVSLFSLRYIIQYPDLIQHAIIQQSLEENDGTVYPFIFDIDVHRDRLEISDNYDQIWQLFDELRILKNELFFNNLTQKTLILLNETDK